MSAVPLLLALVALTPIQEPVPVIPEAAPKRILLTATQDLARSATVTWRTDMPTPNAGGELALASSDPRFVKTAQPYSAESTPFTLPSGRTVYYHTVRFTGLTPNTQYLYRIGSPWGWCEWVQHRTSKTTDDPFAFVYFGDAQNDVKSLWSRVVRQAFRDLPGAAFFLHAGDLINEDMIDEEWGDWFYAGGWIHNQVPVFATPGNHEYQTIDEKKVLTPFWKPQFANPENGPAGLERTSFYMDYQGTRFISLNSNERLEEQTAWLDKVLSENKGNWAIVTFHHPVYSTGFGRDNPKVRELWKPILEKHKVPLVLQGHDHSYGRRNIATGVSGSSEHSGTVYVVSVSGPKMYRLAPETATTMPRRAEYTQLYQIVRVEPKKIKYEAYLSTGELYDAFELTRKPDGNIAMKVLEVTTAERIEKTPATSRRDPGL